MANAAKFFGGLAKDVGAAISPAKPFNSTGGGRGATVGAVFGGGLVAAGDIATIAMWLLKANFPDIPADVLVSFENVIQLLAGMIFTLGSAWVGSWFSRA